jgi:hypothetical protein
MLSLKVFDHAVDLFSGRLAAQFQNLIRQFIPQRFALGLIFPSLVIMIRRSALSGFPNGLCGAFRTFSERVPITIG